MNSDSLVSTRKKVCINTANLHCGGGVQVATSFLRELANIENAFGDKDVTIYLSSEVATNLAETVNVLKQKFDVEEFDVYGLEAVSLRVRNKYSNFHLIFSVFGPDYLPFLRAKKVIGFAQPWILYDKSDAYKRLGIWSLLKLRLAFWVKKQLFKGADAYIVELEHVKEGMLSKRIGRGDNIHIVYNSISRNYREMDSQKLLHVENPSGAFNLGIISRNYSHKNLSILPKIKRILEEVYQIDVKFYVTFNEKEFRRESLEFQTQIVNLGTKRVDECIDTYLKFDAVIFPSLLECFSATPLEAMATGRTLFASDRRFNRDVCGEHAYYFDPLCPEEAARLINYYIKNKWGRDMQDKYNARQHAINFSSPKDRAVKYIEIIDQVLS